MAEQQQKSQPSWPELMGSGHWSGLIEPLDLSLLNLLLQCGDLCQVTYDTFNNDEHSKYCGSCRYAPNSLLSKAEFPASADFSTPHYLYATSSLDLPASFLLFSLSREAWSKESNWIGYVVATSDSAAAASGHREIYVVWRGTIRDLEWVDVLQPEQVSLEPLLNKNNNNGEDDEVKVMKGWYAIYTSSDPKSPFSVESARDQLLAKIKELVELYKNEKLSIICVGHSLGASLATLSAFDIVENDLSKIGDNYIQVSAFVFGCPQVGNKAFNNRLERLPNLRVLHSKHGVDLIPLYPTGLLGFAYTGVELVVDVRKSPYLKDSKNPSDWHNLQAILHSLAGWNGKDGEFKLRVNRSIALVNKSSDYLKDECLIPASWWVEKNKGMVLGEDGQWQLAQPSDEDLPIPPTYSRKALDEKTSEDNVAPPSTQGNADKVVPPNLPTKDKANSKPWLSSFVCCFRAPAATN